MAQKLQSARPVAVAPPATGLPAVPEAPALAGREVPRRWRLRRWWGAHRGAVAGHAVLALCLLVFMLPIIWSISASFKGKTELFAPVPSLLPANPTLANYVYVLRRMGTFPLYFLNSLVVTVGSVALIVVAASLAGYAFGRLRFRFRDLIFYTLVLQVFVPRAGGLMAMYELMQTLHLRNSLPGLILLFSGGIAIPVFIMRQTFFNIPGEFEDAAAIDGANRWQAFWLVMAPMGASGMVLVAIFSFIGIWGEFLVTLTMIDRSELWTLAVAVANLSLSTTSFNESEILPYGTTAAAYLLAALPAAVLFIAMQRWFVRGMMEGLKF
jgi:ABC-type glycerol-3-phosphate transport system permease component